MASASQPTVFPAHLVLGALLLGLLPGCCCLPADTSSDGTASCPDLPAVNTTLLQHTFQFQSPESMQASSLQHEDSAVSESGGMDFFDVLLAPGNFDCTLAPRFCQTPFSCHTVSTGDMPRRRLEGLARTGRPNYQAWCGFPEYEEFASKCQAGDLDGAAQAHFQLVSTGALGPHKAELDASSCFILENCADAQVTNTTTVEAGLEMCDKRFGREAWAGFGALTSPPGDQLNFKVPTDPANGFASAAQTRPYSLASCAMGIHHCEVHYCRETFCKDEHYIKKYGHHLREHGLAA